MSSKRKSPPTKLEGSAGCADGSIDLQETHDLCQGQEPLELLNSNSNHSHHSMDGERPACKKSKTLSDSQVWVFHSY